MGSPDLHPLLASIYEAASFAPAGSAIAAEAAEIVNFVHSSLHPAHVEPLVLANMSQAKFPLVFAAPTQQLPLCPITLKPY